MAQVITNPRGTVDVLMDESYKWQYVKSAIAGICARFGYREIHLPTFEYTEVFERGVGETTDVVGKEMYTMTDKGGRSITLRPEGTANTARAFLQHGVLAGALPARGYYIMSCFRYEKPQSGRQREFYQFGIELFGAAEPDADCEVIRVAAVLLRELGVQNIRLEINSIGCPKCRPTYHKALGDYFESRKTELCDTCNDRMTRNPLRILDCKSPACQAIANDAPITLDYLCDDCKQHFAQLQQLLALADIDFSINPRIVRGLDYYSRTVFEFVHEAAGAQGTVCGGGRYDGLVELLGGPHTPGIGFGMGVGRLLSVMEAEGVDIPLPEPPALFICTVGEAGRAAAQKLTYALQDAGLAVQYDVNGRSLKAQLKYADKLNARYTLALGDDEVAANKAELRNMADGTTVSVDLDAAQLAAALRDNTR